MEGKEHENILRLVGISQVSLNIFHDSDVRDIFMLVTKMDVGDMPTAP